MAQAPYLVFTPVPTSVDSGATLDTLQFDQQQVQSNTAKLAMDGNVTGITVSSTTPTQLLTNIARNFFNVISASDGSPFQVGTSSAQLATGNGALVSQGSRLKVTGYLGTVWVIGVGGTSVQLFYQTG